MPSGHAGAPASFADGGANADDNVNPFLRHSSSRDDADDVIVLDPRRASSPSAASRWPLVCRTCARHGTDVLDYLSLLAWNRCVMGVVGGPARTTIDALMTRQFHGLMLVWVWIYTVAVSSFCAWVVRKAIAARVAMEVEESWEAAVTTIRHNATSSGYLASSSSSSSAPHAAAAATAAAVGKTLKHRFRVSVYKRVASAFTYVTMWAWAVALLGSLPSDAFYEDLASVFALSLAFAVTVWAGQRGYGPLKALLRLNGAPPNTAHHTAGTTTTTTTANSNYHLTAGDEVALAAYTGVTVSCEWILAVAWVGLLRHGADIVFDAGGSTRAASGAAAKEGGQMDDEAMRQGAVWLTACVAVVARGAFVVACTAHRHRRHHRRRRRAAGGESLLPAAAAAAGGGGGGGGRERYAEDAGPLSLSSSSLMSSSVASIRRVQSRAAVHLMARVQPGLQVARSARAMMMGAFAFSTGVALNAAAQTTWRTMAAAWGMGAVPPAVMYATALSAVTVAAASYGAACRDDVAEKEWEEGEWEEEEADGDVRTGKPSDHDEEASGGVGGVDAREVGGEGGDEGVTGTARGCYGSWGGALREVGARKLVAELCADEERVGAFVAGFVWNTALVLWCGPDVVEDWRWLVAFAVTFVAAAVNVLAEWTGVSDA